jgi:hypothetical protein
MTLLSLELHDRTRGTKDFLLHDLHAQFRIDENSGLDEVSRVAMSLTTHVDLCTIGLSGLDVSHNSLAKTFSMMRFCPSYARRIEFGKFEIRVGS